MAAPEAKCSRMDMMPSAPFEGTLHVPSVAHNVNRACAEIHPQQPRRLVTELGVVPNCDIGDEHVFDRTPGVVSLASVRQLLLVVSGRPIEGSLVGVIVDVDEAKRGLHPPIQTDTLQGIRRGCRRRPSFEI